MLFTLVAVCAVMILAGMVRYAIIGGRIAAVITKREFKLIRYALSILGGTCITAAYYDDIFMYLRNTSTVAIIFALLGVAISAVFCLGAMILPIIGGAVSRARLKHLKKKLRKRFGKHRPRH